MSLPHKVRVQTARVATDRFVLTGAIRPARGSPACPTVGYRRHVLAETPKFGKLAVLLAAASRDDIIPLFFDLIDALGPAVTVVVHREPSPDEPSPECWRSHIDTAVLQSILVDFTDLVLNDGYLKVSVLGSPDTEVRLDDHKNLIVFARDPAPFVEVLAAHGVPARPDLSVISDWPHLHFSTEGMAAGYDALVQRLGAETEDEATDEAD